MSSRKEVALRAGVSATSVSYYINNTGYVSVDARKRIQKAIDELGYRPNQMARSLRSGDTKQFVFFCNEIRNPFYSQLVYSASQKAIENGYIILFSTVMDDDEYISKICGYQISGVFASNNRLDVKTVNSIAEHCPVVILRDVDWKEMSPNVTQIKVDYSHIFHEAIQHLCKSGYKRFHYISGSNENGVLDAKTKGFIEAVEGYPFGILYGITNARKACDALEKCGDMRKDDAILCTNDAVAFGVRKAVDMLGLRIPQDVGLVGFDNTPFSSYSVPGITSVDIHTENVGEIAISLLIKKLKNEQVDEYVIEPELVVRESSQREI